mmetsp:Transcript_19658/g.32233  ORF Transcript_19658/g.32233 Transcript_19658/m.32233 type:complete len:101 (+) Transcript_19658:794-1096(+)
MLSWTSMLCRVSPRKTGGKGDENVAKQILELKTLKFSSLLRHQRGTLIGQGIVHLWLLSRLSTILLLAEQKRTCYFIATPPSNTNESAVQFQFELIASFG